MRLFKHLGVVLKHRHLVMKYCFKLGIPFQGLIHDLSKFSFVEFFNSVKYYQGTRSPNDKEREVKGYSLSWMHHKGRNKHHYEYWIDVDNESHVYRAVEMPIRYLKEMFADRISASKIYKGKNYKDSDPYDYFITHIERKEMHVNSKNIMEEWLLMLKEKGEKETISYIKKNYKNK